MVRRKGYFTRKMEKFIRENVRSWYRIKDRMGRVIESWVIRLSFEGSI
jgi:hypothetical protein